MSTCAYTHTCMRSTMDIERKKTTSTFYMLYQQTASITAPILHRVLQLCRPTNIWPNVSGLSNHSWVEIKKTPNVSGLNNPSWVKIEKRPNLSGLKNLMGKNNEENTDLTSGLWEKYWHNLSGLCPSALPCSAKYDINNNGNNNNNNINNLIFLTLNKRERGESYNYSSPRCYSNYRDFFAWTLWALWWLHECWIGEQFSLNKNNQFTVQGQCKKR